MKIILIICASLVYKISCFAQPQEIFISILEDTIFVRNNMILFEVEFNNHTQQKIELYYSKDVCKCSQEDYERFSRGLSILPVEDGNTFFCTYSPKKVRLINYTDRQMKRIFSREAKKKKYGSFFCRKRSIVLKPGITTRKYSVSLCKDLPQGEFKLQLKYSYFRDKTIIYNCVKCYPKRKKKKKYFEGTISSEPIILIKH